MRRPEWMCYGKHTPVVAAPVEDYGPCRYCGRFADARTGAATHNGTRLSEEDFADMHAWMEAPRMGADRVIIVNPEGEARFITEGEAIQPHPKHKHVFGLFGRRCKICNKTRQQILLEETQ